MSRHARRFMPLLPELPRTFQVDPARSRRTTGSLPYLEKKKESSRVHGQSRNSNLFLPSFHPLLLDFFRLHSLPFLHLSVFLFLYHIFFFS